MKTKYGFEFPISTVTTNNTRLTNQIWKLIPMKENSEDWEKQLQTVVVEVCGLSDIFIEEPDYLTLLSKLEGLKCDLDFSLFRKTIFECISLTQRMMKKYD